MLARTHVEREPGRLAAKRQHSNGATGLGAWMAAGGAAGALAASTCCAVPLLLFSLGISGAWIGNLTMLEPLKPAFIAAALVFLGFGYHLAYRRQTACVAGTACAARPLPSRLVMLSLWVSTLLVLIALFWNWIAPVIAPLMLGP